MNTKTHDSPLPVNLTYAARHEAGVTFTPGEQVKFLVLMFNRLIPATVIGIDKDKDGYPVVNVELASGELRTGYYEQIHKAD